MKNLRLLLMLLGPLSLLGCKHPIITPQNNSSTVTVPVTNPGNVTSTNNDTICFQTQVLPLYQSYCGSCHNGTSTAGGDDDIRNLTDYADIMQGISPGNPNASRYYTIIGRSMPPAGQPQMSADQVAIIAKWISQGAQNTTCTNLSCDTSLYLYSNSASVIFSTYCIGCHGTAPGSGNVLLNSYANASAYITGNQATFLQAIHYQLGAGKNMPPAGQLDSCQINQLTKWVQKGLPK